MKLLKANWTAPASVEALCTTRQFGNSLPPYQRGNLGLHVGDSTDTVIQNRKLLSDFLKLSKEPHWLEQVHGTDCIIAEQDSQRVADAAITRQKHTPLVIITADCLPIALSNDSGTEIGIIHAGWKGLLNGVVENTLSKMLSSETELMAWIGPSICHRCYEVGNEVYTAFVNKYSFSRNAFVRQGEKWLANLALISEMILNYAGVKLVFQSNQCTFEMQDDYFSYRRDQKTGRIATLIWIN